MTLLNKKQIEALIPHREPILMVDSVEKIDQESGHIIAHKHLKEDDGCLEGHFPGHPIMPGVLMIEAMAQASAVFVTHTLGRKSENTLFYFMTIEKAKFRKPVMPTCTLEFDVKLIKQKRDIYIFSGTTSVDGTVCVEAEFMAKILER